MPVSQSSAALEALKAALKEQARALGLDAVGVASAEPFEKEREFLQAREALGLGPHPFEHPEVAQRVEPAQLLPGAQAIISCAISYHEPDFLPDTAEGPTGWFSRYCRGLDYHQLLGERLGKLAAWLEFQVPGTRTQVHSDMGPPLDRAIAERAGLGRFGKSTLLIVPRLGTMTFLGEILTDLPLPPDPPASWSPCGSCTRCLDACPTGALTEWKLNPFTCLGYVNQESGVMPMDYREVMGDRLFGCDDCQDVCPYNRAAVQGLHPEFAPLPEPGGRPSLTGLLSMSPDEFTRQFEPTAAAWRGQETIQRNALVALGNSGDVRALAPLCDTLSHDSALLRAHAAWALGRLAQLVPAIAESVREALTARQAIEHEATVTDELTQALTMLPRKETP